MGMSPLAGKYDTAVDRESAFEVLRARAEEAAREAEEAERAEAEAEEKEREFKAARRYTGEGVSRSSSRTRSSRSDSVTTTFAKSFARQLGTKSGQALVRGVLGGLFRGR
jgi:septal ring factor EnvC (AmiA/AmiB activator)